LIVFDTSAVIEFLRGNEQTKSVVQQTELQSESVAITTVSLFELLSPFYHRNLQKEEESTRSFLSRCVILVLDSDSAEEASRIMGHLLRMGRPVNALGALISGIALSNKASAIVTKDRDFREVAKVANIEVHMF